MNTYLTESDLESAVLEWFTGLGYFFENGPAIALGGTNGERVAYTQDVFSLGFQLPKPGSSLTIGQNMNRSLIC